MAEARPNKGQELLVKAVRKHGTLRSLSRTVGIKEPQLGHYYRGTRIPYPPARKKLQAKLRIGWTLWDEPADGAA